MNNIEELKTKKPENLKSRSSVLADYVTDDNSGGYFVVECGNCGEIFPSQKLDGGGAIADTGDYGDSYCPHCNAVDPDECDNAGLVWNIQQAKINALIAQLEAVQKERDELKELNRHFDLSIRKTEGVNEVLRSKLEAAERVLIKPLPISELIHRLEYQTYEKWFSESDVKYLWGRAAKSEAALSAANERLKREQVPVESHRVCQVLLDDAWVDVSYGAMEHQKKHGVETRILFTSAPRPAGFTVDGES